MKSARKLVIATLLLATPACHSPRMVFREDVAPPSSPYSVSATVETLRDHCFGVMLSIGNRSSQPLPLEPAMFEMTAPPAVFLQLTRLSFGRKAFRMPPSIAAGGVENGEVFFQMHPGHEKPESATLHVKLPDGDHQAIFDFR